MQCCAFIFWEKPSLIILPFLQWNLKCHYRIILFQVSFRGIITLIIVKKYFCRRNLKEENFQSGKYWSQVLYWKQLECSWKLILHSEQVSDNFHKFTSLYFLISPILATEMSVKCLPSVKESKWIQFDLECKIHMYYCGHTEKWYRILKNRFCCL
jgi:hypothetical protein